MIPRHGTCGSQLLDDLPQGGTGEPILLLIAMLPMLAGSVLMAGVVERGGSSLLAVGPALRRDRGPARRAHDHDFVIRRRDLFCS